MITTPSRAVRHLRLVTGKRRVDVIERRLAALVRKRRETQRLLAQYDKAIVMEQSRLEKARR